LSSSASKSSSPSSPSLTSNILSDEDDTFEAIFSAAIFSNEFDPFPFQINVFPSFIRINESFVFKLNEEGIVSHALTFNSFVPLI